MAQVIERFLRLALTATLALVMAPAWPQGGATCPLCNPGQGQESGVGGAPGLGVTVPEGRLTYVSFFMTPHRASGSTSGGTSTPGGGPFPGGPLHHHFTPGSGQGQGQGHGERDVYFLRYGVNSRLEVGLGYWGTTGRPRPAFGWQLVTQSPKRPALLVGYGAEPMGSWKDDGVYLSLVKGFGPAHRRRHAFLALFQEVDGSTRRHLIGGISQPLSPRWSLFVGRYPFNTWEGSVSFQLSPQVQLGLWAADFARSPRLGFSVGTGWQMGRRRAPLIPSLAPEGSSPWEKAGTSPDPAGAYEDQRKADQK